MATVDSPACQGLPRFSVPWRGEPDRRGIILDWDGSITGLPLSAVVKNNPFFTSSLCAGRDHWGDMAVCPHRYSEIAGTGTGYTDRDFVITR